MAIAQPIGTDYLNSPDHAKQHRVIASDPAATDQTITVDASNNVKLGSLAGILKGTAGVVSAVSPVTVSDGGIGVSTLTAYAVICGGTTGTGAVQSIASVGTSGQFLQSQGAGALPTFQTLINRATFTNSDLSSGVLTITHNKNLSAPYSLLVAIFDNNYQQIIPDNVTGAGNTVAIDLTSYGTISGTWGYIYIA